MLLSMNAINMNGNVRRAVPGAEVIQHSGSSRGRALWEVRTNNHVLQGIWALREAFKDF